MVEELEPTERSAQAAQEWDERYAELSESKWSGSPNGSLVEEIQGLSPGRVLEVGCGEGADSIWLAQKGWTVTAVDISTVVIERAKLRAADNGASVDFQQRDISIEPFDRDVFDLVFLCYPALRHPGGQAAIHAAASSITIGGELLVIGHYHDPDKGSNDDGEVMFDPADYVSIDNTKEILGSTFEVVTDEVRDRPNPPAGARHLNDRICRLRRSR